VASVGVGANYGLSLEGITQVPASCSAIIGLSERGGCGRVTEPYIS